MTEKDNNEKPQEKKKEERYELVDVVVTSKKQVQDKKTGKTLTDSQALVRILNKLDNVEKALA